MDAFEEWCKGFRLGYWYGRMDEIRLNPYDDRVPGERVDVYGDDIFGGGDDGKSESCTLGR